MLHQLIVMHHQHHVHHQNHSHPELVKMKHNTTVLVDAEGEEFLVDNLSDLSDPLSTSVVKKRKSVNGTSTKQVQY